MEYFNRLPEEITLDILNRLPSESVLECKLVCKAWRNLVSHHPSFSKMHLHHPNHHDSGKLGFIAKTMVGNFEQFQYFEYNDNHESTPIERIRRVKFTPPFRYASILGSCNGLLCFTQPPLFLRRPTFQSVCICNPLTKEYIMVPEIKSDCCDTDQCVYWESGFGYVSSTNEYKVLGICMWRELHFVEVHIYTLGSGNGWRNLGKFNVGPRELWREVVFANGALYWMGIDLEMIVTFDLAEEKFCEHLSPPPLPPDNYWLENRIGVLNGLLFFAIDLVVEGGVCNDVCVLKRMNDNNDTKGREDNQSLGWSKEYRVDKSRLLAIAKNDGVLSYIDNYLSIYDTKASTLKRLVDFEGLICGVLPHKNTLVSLKGLGEEDTKIMESVGIE